MSAGGKRPGAGRKPRSTPLVAINMRVEPQLADQFTAQKKQLNLSGPKLLDRLLNQKSNIK
jgi:hypothetical protein